MKETIEWHEWTEEQQPPTDQIFLAWMGKASEPWCCTLYAADEEGQYFTIVGTGEFADPTEATHWAVGPRGPDQT